MSDQIITQVAPQIPRRICTCLLSSGIDADADWESEEGLHNSWCDGRTDHRWVIAPVELLDPPTQQSPKGQ